jgi:hypothetical protein
VHTNIGKMGREKTQNEGKKGEFQQKRNVPIGHNFEVIVPAHINVRKA